MRLVVRPVGALDVQVAAQEGGEALGRRVPLQRGDGRRVGPPVVLPRLGQLGQLALDVDAAGAGGAGAGGAVAVRDVEGQTRVLLERVGHHDHAPEQVRPHQRAHGRGEGAEVVADDALHRPVA